MRIASTKATQKITKAMQMVAASKLRRAQAAAEAARPFAERMEKVLGNIAASVTDIESAPRLLAGTGNDQVHLLVVCTAERGLCGPFNSAIVRLAREHSAKLAATGKQVKILCVGRKGYRAAAPDLQKQIVEVDRSAQREEASAFDNAQAVAREHHRPLRDGRIRCRDSVLLPLQVGDCADSDRLAGDPAGISGKRRQRRQAGRRGL